MEFPAVAHGVQGWALLAVLLGGRHGFDADHLAAIDGLTRANAATRPVLARLAGVLFSVGHGVVVVVAAALASTMAGAWHVPEWLGSVGAWTSITVLTLLAVANIASVLRAPADDAVALVGWRAGIVARCLVARTPLALMGVGGLFALSFDTVSQAGLFAIAAQRFGGLPATLTLASLFIAGMLFADGINGVWIAQLIRRADLASRIASRTMALAVAGVGLLTAGLGAAVQTSPAAAAWAADKELWFGAAVLAVVSASYVLGRRLCRQAIPVRRGGA